jgi:hypothetical protein
VAWKGWDKCQACGFVPIGVGLDKSPKDKRKKRKAKYREPGSSAGLLWLILLGALGFGAYRFQPWADNWEMVRTWIGQGRHHSVVGEWVIQKVVSTGKAKPLITGLDIDQGLLKFGDKGSVDIELIKGEEKTTATGRYAVLGTLVMMKSVEATVQGAGPVPHAININLHWTGPNAVIASYNGTETIYLRRHPLGEPLADLMEMGIKPDAGPATGQMRGSYASILKGANDATNGGG